MLFANIFSLSVRCLLVLLIVPFAVKKLLFWWGPSSSFLLLFPLRLETCWVRSCCGQDQRGFCLLSSRESWWLPVLHLGLSSILRLFLCMVLRKWSTSMSLSSFPSSTTCWRDCLYSIGYSFLLSQRLVGHTFVGPFLGSLFCSIDLSVCFSAIKFFFLRERARVGEKGWGRKRVLSRLHAQCRAQCRAWSHDPGITT